MTEEDEEDSIFNIPHSLPSNAHTTAVATRTPSGPPKVKTNKYMPTYGGMFEIPGTKLRHNGLYDGIPFNPNPYMVWMVNPNPDMLVMKQPSSAQCLLVASYLQVPSDSQQENFSLIRASGSTLHLDIATSISCNRNPPEQIASRNYARVPYSYPIMGLKYCDKTTNYVIVNFKEGVKLIQLNSQHKIPPILHVQEDGELLCEHSPTDGDIDSTLISDQPAINFVGSYPALKGVEVIDASLCRNQNILNIASCDKKDLHIKIYDTSRPKRCLSVISRKRDDEASIRLTLAKDTSLARKRTLRSFVPSESSFEKLFQIECIPTHLINSVITTSTKVSQIDPRTDTIVEHYADKFKLTNVMPTEHFRRLEFSRRNDYQFYLLSDQKIRVFDRRFRYKDMNILDHMLEFTQADMMSTQLFSVSSEIETLCISSYGRLCFVSFDQSLQTHDLIQSAGPLVNPRSIHQPVHEPSPIELTARPGDQLYGLAVSSSSIFDSEDILFSTLQLSSDGKVCIRGFPKARACEIPNLREPRLRSETFRNLDPTHNQCNPDIDLSEYRVLGTEEEPELDHDCIESVAEIGMVEDPSRLKSKRAIAKYESIKKICRR